jgi:serine/threonine protein kinase
MKVISTPTFNSASTSNPNPNPKWILPISSCVIDPGPILGAGGFGVVRKGTYQEGPRMYSVALKIMSEQNQSNVTLRNKFFEEVSLLMELRSPFLVEVYGVCDFMLVMELMSLGSLYNVIGSNQSVIEGMEIRLQVMLDTMKGIEYLHENNLIHGDLKSPNILLTEEGSSLKAKLSDFSLSRLNSGQCQCQNQSGNQNSNPNQNQVGNSSAPISTKWAAPELLEGLSQPSRESDIYAFGMVMWELLSLRRPYFGLSSGAIIRKIGMGEREVIPNDTPPELSRLIVSCWNENREKRPVSGVIIGEIVSFQRGFLLLGKEDHDGLKSRTTQSHLSKSTPSGSHSGQHGYQVRFDHNSLNLDSTCSGDVIGKSGIQIV